MRPDSYSTPIIRYEHPDLGDEPRPDPGAEARIALAKRCGEIQSHFFPGHPFKIVVFPANKTGEHSIIGIQLKPFMGGNWYYRIPTTLISNANDLQRHVLLGCGEILERYRMPRQNFSPKHYVDALTAIPAWQRIHGHVPD